MCHLTIRVDGDTVMDGDQGDWGDPPKMLADYIKPVDPKRPTASHAALMMAMLEAITTDRDLTADLNHTDAGWTLACTR